MPKISTGMRYTLYGAAFGLLFPLVGTLIICFQKGIGPLLAQSISGGGPLLWIIDTAPVVLAFFSRFAGNKQEAIELKLKNQETGLNEIDLKRITSLDKKFFVKKNVYYSLFTFVLFMALSLIIYLTILNEQKQNYKRSIKNQGKHLVANAKIELDERLKALDRMASRVVLIDSRSRISWLKDAKNYTDNFVGLHQLMWVKKKDGKPLWIYKKQQIISQIPNLNLKDVDFNLEYTDVSSEGGEFYTFNDKSYILSLHPTFDDKKRVSGFIVALYDLGLILDKIFSKNFSYNVYVNGILSGGTNNLKVQHKQSELINLRNNTFLFKLNPKNSVEDFYRKGKTPEIILLLLFLASSLVTLVVYLYLNDKEKTSILLIDLKQNKDALDEVAIVSQTDNEGIVVDVNKKFCEISGYDYSQLIGQKHNIISSGYHSSEFMQNMWRTILSGEIWRGEIKNKNKNGHEYWIDSSIIPLKNKWGVVKGYTSISNDITQKKQWEEDLIQAQDIAQKALQTKSLFLANMSHEIRTPLNGIIGCTHLLMENLKLPENIKLLKTILACGDTLLTLINDILDFSKLESKKMEMEKSPYNLKENFFQVGELFEPRAREKNIRFLTSFDEQIPETVIGDVTRFRQVLGNLISNAIKFTSVGEVKVEAKLNGYQEDNLEIQFRVSDTGEGLKEEDMKKLFKSFSQVDASTTKKFGGTGLGLAICKSLTELMGGEIRVESQYGQGATFIFSMLVKKANLLQTLDRQNKKNVDSFEEHTTKILLVDDNEVNRMVGKKILEKRNCAVSLAINGEDAIEKIKYNDFDMVLMDCQMPVMDGLTATRLIRENLKKTDLFIVALTASALKEDQDKCLSAGMDDFISKPIEIKQIERVVTKCWQKKDLEPLLIEEKREKSVRLHDLKESFSGNMTILTETIESFLTKVDDYVADIQIALELQKYEKIERMAHLLISDAGVFCADQLVGLLKDLEIASSNKALQEVTELNQKLKQEVTNVKEDLIGLIRKKAA